MYCLYKLKIDRAAANLSNTTVPLSLSPPRIGDSPFKAERFDAKIGNLQCKAGICGLKFGAFYKRTAAWDWNLPEVIICIRFEQGVRRKILKFSYEGDPGTQGWGSDKQYSRENLAKQLHRFFTASRGTYLDVFQICHILYLERYG
jgi:hypothetical protein